MRLVIPRPRRGAAGPSRRSATAPASRRCLSRGRCFGATVSTNEPGLELEETRFYADDPWKKKWYERFEAGLAGGYGNGFAVQGHVGWGGWNVYLQHDRTGETCMFGLKWDLF